MSELGSLLATFRRRRRQPNGLPWSQEDLATAAGTDKAHINRIERGRTVPSRETVSNIAAGLELSYADTNLLLSLAGHAPVLETPSPAAVDRAIAEIRPLLERAGHPVQIFDYSEASRFVNADWLALFALTPTDYADRVRGRALIDAWLDPTARPPALRGRENWRSFARVVIALERLAVRRLQFCPCFRDRLARRLVDPDFREIWTERAEDEAGAATPLLSLRHATLGERRFAVIISRLAWDDRFYISQYIPAGGAPSPQGRR